MPRLKSKPKKSLVSAARPWNEPHIWRGQCVPSIADPNEWFSVKQAAAYLGVYRTTILKYDQQGTLERRQHGKWRLVSKASLDALWAGVQRER